MALETVTYTNPQTNVSITFGDNTLPNVVYNGITGIGLSPVDNFVVDTAYQAGAIFVRTKQKPTVVTIHLTVLGFDSGGTKARVQLFQTVDTILGVLQPQITQTGTLVKTMADGSQRKLKSIQYVGGFEVKDQAANYARVDLDLVFEAYDPTWYSATSYTSALGSSSDVTGFTVPFSVPLTAAGQATGTAILTNHGNIDAHPLFTFNGPLSNASVTNQTTGESFALLLNLNTGDVVTIDTWQGSITYTPAGGTPTPYYSAFGGSRQWIRIISGNNNITFSRDNPGNNQCTVAWSDTWNHG